MTPDQYRREGAEAMREAAADMIENKCSFMSQHGMAQAIRAIDVDEVLAGLRPRCAECDCEDGNCTWIKSGSDPVAQLMDADTPRAWTDVLDERKRQTTVEGWTPEHDDEHDEGELAAAAGSYAINAACMLSPYDGVPRDELPDTWPPEWDVKWWKPSPDNPRRDLVKAGALILAEIERLDRAVLAQKETDHDHT